MRPFLIKVQIISFLIGMIGISLIQFGLKQAISAIPPSTTTIIAGDSHGTGLRLPNSFNTCHPADPLSVQTSIVSQIINHKSIQQIFLVIGPQSFSNEPSEYLNSKTWVKSQSSRLAVGLWNDPKTSLPLVTTTTAIGSLQGIIDLKRKPNLFQGSMSDYGHKTNLSAERTAYRLKVHDVLRENWNTEIKWAIKTLQKFYDICKPLDIELFIICTPTHKDYMTQINQDSWNECLEQLSQFANDKDNCTFEDFTETSFDDSLFYDCDHLNMSGFEYFNNEYLLCLAHQ